MGKSRKTTIYLISAMIAWGSVYPVSKYLMSDLSAMTLGFLRYFVAIISLTPFFIPEIIKNGKKININMIILLIAAGLAGTAVFGFFLYTGVARSTASNGSILINTQPIFASLLAPLLIKERIRGSQIAGIIIGFAGMLLVVTGGKFDFSPESNNYIAGNTLLVLGAISMALYGIIIKKPVREIGGILTTWLSMAFGTLLLFITSLFVVNNFFYELSSIKGRDILLILYLGSIATAAAYMLFSLSLKEYDVVTSTAYKFLIPVSGVSLSIIFLEERPAIAVYAGILIVVFSVFLIQKDLFSKTFLRKTKS